eukprot:364380-Chlamydomonas_euryale.AAC.9
MLLLPGLPPSQPAASSFRPLTIDFRAPTMPALALERLISTRPFQPYECAATLAADGAGTEPAGKRALEVQRWPAQKSAETQPARSVSGR